MAATLKLIGGRLCLDFANTVDWHGSPRSKERLITYEDLVAWARHGGAVTDAEARRLLAMAAANPDAAKQAHRQAVELREAIYRIFSAVASGRPPAYDDVRLLNEALAAVLPRRRLVREGQRFQWAWAELADALDRPLWPLVVSAAELLTSEELARVRRCADDECGWLFLDLTRNRSRRWCSMEDCGNRHKARRHYRRIKGRLPPAQPAHAPGGSANPEARRGGQG